MQLHRIISDGVVFLFLLKKVSEKDSNAKYVILKKENYRNNAVW
jgi:hypothetical protein